MAIINPEDILKNDGDIAKVLKEKRVEAAIHLEKTGSLPQWWELGVSLAGKKGPPPKFTSPDEYFSLGYEYFEMCAKADVMPTRAGLILHLGFSNTSSFHAYARRNIEFRYNHSRLLTMLQLPYEQTLTESGGQTGKIFALKNLPDGFSAEDPVDKKLEFPWKDKQQTEITGADEGPIIVKRDMDPEEAYMRMLEGGTLATEEEEEDAA